MMHTLSTWVGGAVLAAGAFIATEVIFPTPPIVVHSLTYKDGLIYQDRTVDTDSGTFFAQWNATILDGNGVPVSFCTGKGTWDYPAGRVVAEMDLARWTGNKNCTPEALREIGEIFAPQAVWHWGEDSTGKTGLSFRP